MKRIKLDFHLLFLIYLEHTYASSFRLDALVSIFINDTLITEIITISTLFTTTFTTIIFFFVL